MLYPSSLAFGALLAHVVHGPAASATNALPQAQEAEPSPLQPQPSPATLPPAPSQPPTVQMEAVPEQSTEPAEPPVPHDGMGERFAEGLIVSGSTPHRLILFTFDDGPDRRTTPLLLDRLDAAGVKAVFFLTASRLHGRNLAERQQIRIAREIVERGHLAANHTVDHLQLPLLTDAAALEQIIGTETIFEKVFGARPWLLRPPGGARSERIDRLIKGRGYTTMLWNLGAGDFQVRTAEDVFETWKKVFERREREEQDRGGIILLHDTYAWSVDAFELIYAELMRRNCRLLQEDEELYDIVGDPAFFITKRTDQGASELAPAATLPADVLERRQAQLREETSQRCSGL